MTLWQLTLPGACSLAAALPGSCPAYADTRGISPVLAAAPPYRCVSNVYVDAAHGSNADPGRQAEPWKSLFAADNGSTHTPKPGECISVLTTHAAQDVDRDGGRAAAWLDD
jgi:hypothetical protein